MKCSYCNNEIPNGMQKCPSCGAPVEVQQTSTQTVATPQQAHAPDLNATMQTMLQQQMMQQVIQQQQILNQQSVNMQKSSKSRLTFILLALFLGILGVHNFYIGKIGKGIIQLILTCTVLGISITSIWVLIEIFIVRTDAQGKELS